MRMWMINPKKMCRKHLLGEHVETHMLLGSFERGKTLNGFVIKNCLEPKEIFNRHNLLAEEMISRGYNHKSPMDKNNFENYVLKNKIYTDILNAKVIVEKSEEDLFGRCVLCRNLNEKFLLRESKRPDKSQ